MSNGSNSGCYSTSIDSIKIDQCEQVFIDKHLFINNRVMLTIEHVSFDRRVLCEHRFH
jgi:hypothetical protein